MVSSGTKAATLVGLISAVAAPFAGHLAGVIGDGDETKIFLSSALVCVCSTLLIYITVLRNNVAKIGSNVYLAFFSFFTFACMCDLWLGFAIDKIHPLFDFYLTNGEPYLNTAHGSGLNWWDASAHFLLYLRFIQAMIDGKRHDQEVLFWLGSICGSLMIMVPAVFTGKFSDEVKTSFLLNLPFMVLPIFYSKRVLYDDFKGNKANPARRSSASSHGKFEILFLPAVAFITVAIGLYGVRFFAALESKWPLAVQYAQSEPYLMDPTNYLRVHCLVQFFYTVPLYFVAIYALLGGSRALPVSLYHASVVNFGHMCQSEFAWVKGAFHEKNPSSALAGGHQFWISHVGSVLVAWMVMELLRVSVGVDGDKKLD